MLAPYRDHQAENLDLVVCTCNEGWSGVTCGTCASGYYGVPDSTTPTICPFDATADDSNYVYFQATVAGVETMDAPIYFGAYIH